MDSRFRGNDILIMLLSMDFLNYLIPTDPAYQQALNIVLHGVHTGMVLFMLVGWAFRRLLLMHRILLGLIWASWLGLGVYVDFLGYCILTDWHWRLLEAMGQYGMPPSYIEYMLWQLGAPDVPDVLVAYGTGAAFVILTVLSLLRQRHKKLC